LRLAVRTTTDRPRRASPSTTRSETSFMDTA
jgi:hypothetical protein